MERARNSERARRACHVPARAFRACASRAFTLVELLIVIVVLGVLITMIVVVAGKVLRNQKVALTRSIQQSALMAIEQFATIDPLKAQYNTSQGLNVRPTFGAYPPYPLDAISGPTTLVSALEPGPVRPNDLETRLKRDLFTASGATVDLDNDPEDLINHDMRSLFTYLHTKAPATLAQVSDRYLTRMSQDTTKDIVRPNGAANDPTSFDVMGIHDAWGVPMDYMLYVKVAAQENARGIPQWVVVDRKPVLRSLGIDREHYDAMRAAIAAGTSFPLDANDWIFSEDLPAPEAGGPYANPSARQTFWSTGQLGPAGPGASPKNGWARAVSQADATRRGMNTRVFGFLPDPDLDK
jgi:prepilin-type N-terminal cleavage/methylation domain-containing protein